MLVLVYGANIYHLHTQSKFLRKLLLKLYKQKTGKVANPRSIQSKLIG